MYIELELYTITAPYWAPNVTGEKNVQPDLGSNHGALVNGITALPTELAGHLHIFFPN
jgi:hypothetical protein